MTWWQILLLIVGINWGSLLLLYIYPLVMTWVFKDFKFEGFHGIFGKFRLLGDERAYWNDPDSGACSGEFIIEAHDHNGYHLRNEEGSVLIAAEWEVDLMEPWHVKAWKDWGGVGLGLFMCYRDRIGKADDAWVARTIIHEGTHNIQTTALGLLKFVLDLVFMLFIFIFLKDKHPYLDNPFERQARRRAGQTVDIPRDQWPQGKDDRNPWW